MLSNIRNTSWISKCMFLCPRSTVSPCASDDPNEGITLGIWAAVPVTGMSFPYLCFLHPYPILTLLQVPLLLKILPRSLQKEVTSVPCVQHQQFISFSWSYFLPKGNLHLCVCPLPHQSQCRLLYTGTPHSFVCTLETLTESFILNKYTMKG
jgi:hypothetical protein